MKFHLLSETDLSRMLIIEEAAHLTPWTEEIFQRCFRAGYFTWGAELSENLIGFVMYSNQAGECHILNLCVHPAYQSRGYGGQLLTHALEDAKQKRASIAFLEVRRSNERAISLYHKMGFVEVGVRKAYYPATEGREDAILLAKELSLA